MMPVVCPIDRYSTMLRGDVNHIDVYDEVRHAIRYRQVLSRSFRLYEFERRLRTGSFAQLDRGFEGHDIVFLHPFEMVRALSASSVLPAITTIDITRLGMFRESRQLEKYLGDLWYKGGIIVSSCIAEAVVDNLAVKYKRVGLHEYTYCYGRMRRIIRRMDVKTLISNTSLEAFTKDRSSEDVVELIYEFLVTTPTHWPCMVLGLVVDRARNWVITLNPSTLDLIEPSGVEELRILVYGGRRIPVIVVEKLILIRKLSIDKPSRRLGELLSLKVIKTHLPYRVFPDEV